MLELIQIFFKESPQRFIRCNNAVTIWGWAGDTNLDHLFGERGQVFPTDVVGLEVVYKAIQLHNFQPFHYLLGGPLLERLKTDGKSLGGAVDSIKRSV